MRKFFCELPAELADEVEAAKPEAVVEIGVEWTRRQVVDLLNRGAPSIHFYLMQSAKAVTRLLDTLDVTPTPKRVTVQPG